MSTLDPNKLRRDLLLEEAINAQLDAVVRQANQTAALLKRSDRMEESQLRNLLNTSIESRSPEVVVNFIRYQIARSGSAWGTGPDDFGHTVIKDLRGEITTIRDQALKVVRDQMGDDPEVEALAHHAYVRLMQLYLGYLSRAFYYGKKTNDFDKLTEVVNAS